MPIIATASRLSELQLHMPLGNVNVTSFLERVSRAAGPGAERFTEFSIQVNPTPSKLSYLWAH